MTEVIERLKKLESIGFEKFYEDRFIQIEKIVDYNPEKPPYRMEWALKQLSSLPKGSKILDIGCGNGLMAKILSREGFQVVGVDISQTATDTAKRNVPEATFLKVDVDSENFPFKDGEFDGIVSLEVLEHVKNLKHLTDEFFRVLRPNGRFAVSVPIDKNHNCIEHLRFFDFYHAEEVFHDYTPNFHIMRIFKSINGEKERTLWGIEGEK